MNHALSEVRTKWGFSYVYGGRHAVANYEFFKAPCSHPLSVRIDAFAPRFE